MFDLLELQSQMAMSHFVGAANPGPVEEQRVLLIDEPALLSDHKAALNSVVLGLAG